MSIVGRAAKAAFRTTWGPHDSDTAQAFRWSVVGEDYETKARAALLAALNTDCDDVFESVQSAVALALTEDVDDEPLAVTRAVFATLRGLIERRSIEHQEEK